MVTHFYFTYLQTLFLTRLFLLLYTCHPFPMAAYWNGAPTSSSFEAQVSFYLLSLSFTLLITYLFVWQGSREQGPDDNRCRLGALYVSTRENDKSWAELGMTGTRSTWSKWRQFVWAPRYVAFSFSFSYTLNFICFLVLQYTYNDNDNEWRVTVMNDRYVFIPFYIYLTKIVIRF